MSDPTPAPHADDEPARGRRIVLEPTPPGLWAVLLGTAVAALAPMGGFLVGGAIGTSDTQPANDPMFLALFVGMVVGGVGVLVAVLGGIRLWRHLHRSEVAAEEQVRAARTAPGADAERDGSGDVPGGRPSHG